MCDSRLDGVGRNTSGPHIHRRANNTHEPMCTLAHTHARTHARFWPTYGSCSFLRQCCEAVVLVLLSQDVTCPTQFHILLYFSNNTYKSKGSSYIAQYPILRTAQSALHFTSLTDLFTQTPSRLLWEASSHMLQLMREGCSYTYPPLSIARYSFNSAE